MTAREFEAHVHTDDHGKRVWSVDDVARDSTSVPEHRRDERQPADYALREEHIGVIVDVIV